jgi:hypothetical protein
MGNNIHHSKEACPLQIAREELGYLQSPSALITDNSTASGISNDSVKQRSICDSIGFAIAFGKAISLLNGKRGSEN